jgi:hypothetical protein
VKVTLIEDDTALVSWKLPDEPNLAVTRYTIFYASRKAWVAGEWKVLQREGEPKRAREREAAGSTGLQRQSPAPAPHYTGHWKSTNVIL